MVILFSFFFFLTLLNANNQVITSIYPLKLIIQEIVPSKVQVENVIPANVNPHLFEPTPSILKKIEKADIFIGIQKDFDGWIEQNLKKNVYIFYLNYPHSNPHIWLSPVKILNESDKISQIFIKKFPAYKDTIIKKLTNFKKNLKTIIFNYRNKFSKIKNRNIIEIHPAFDYLAKDFGLNIFGVVFISENQEISVKHYINLIKKAKKSNVKFILSSSTINSRIVSNLKKELKVPVVMINPVGNNEKSYISFITHILDKILLSLQ